MRYLVLILATLFIKAAYGQSFYVVDGKVIDETTNAGIPFASIGIEKQPYGTSTNADGAFTLRIPESIHDSVIITISCTGYEPKKIQNPSQQITIALRPSVIQLKDVLVMSEDLRPEKIVQRAFNAMKKNYNTKPFLYKSFYRHYCKDGGMYGRIIEAAIDVYKAKGYRIQQHTPGQREEVRVTQLRRSYDNTKINSTHHPIALYSVMAADPVGYQIKTSQGKFDFVNEYQVSMLRRRLKDFSFTYEGITAYDEQDVYIIHYEHHQDTLNNATFSARQSGTLYINTKDYAIIKSAWTRYTSHDTIEAVSTYKKFNGKYYLQYASKEGRAYNKRERYQHHYHLELMTSEIVLQSFEKFKGKEPNREGLLKVNYDSTFWNSYNILKATPLEESIAADLEQHQPLKTQYGEFLAAERDRVLGGKEDEENFNAHLKKISGIRPVYIVLWASSCGPCIREMYAAKSLYDEYKTRISFVYVSLDHDIDAWRKMIKKLALESSTIKHYRVGPQGDVVTTFDITSIPRYILVDRQGNFVNMNAPAPNDPSLMKAFESVLGQ
ncbi:carboxypeptidase-like regulatory domain-containing protein [Pseudochryseolinea flava]|nr:carboxypeptidase-like regulatory domain-containing protein [Pseudochryseolinea flava]